MTQDRTEAGFTLVEVLVALVVSALLLGVIMTGALTAHERESQNAERLRALNLGRDIVNRAVASPDVGAVGSGRSGSLRWSLDERVLGRDVRGMISAVRIEVGVFRADGHRLLRLETYKLKSVAGS